MLSCCPKASEAAEPERYGQRQGQQDRDRVDERLELCGEHHIHEDERQREGDTEVVRGAAELA